jgi:hypothetical protein
METEQLPPRSRSWLWYFIGLSLVGVVLVGWLWLFIQQQLSPGQQLSLEQVTAARKKWDEKKIMDYQMLYTVQRGGGSAADNFFVEVKGGKVRKVTLNGRQLSGEGQDNPQSQLDNHSMDRLFDFIEAFVKQDEKPDAGRTYRQGVFDSDDGHLRLFVRRVVGGPERVEIEVKEFRPTPAS